MSPAASTSAHEISHLAEAASGIWAKNGLEVEPEGRDDSQVQATGIHLTSTEHLPCPGLITCYPHSSDAG